MGGPAGTDSGDVGGAAWKVNSIPLNR